MKVRELMTTPIVVVPAITPVREAARQMDYTGVGSLLVVDQEPGRDRIVGIVTDRDLALRVTATDLPGDTPVSEVMSPDPVAVTPDDDVDVALHAFRRHDFRRLPVVDRGTAVGMVTVDDLLLRSYQILGDLLGPVSAEILEPQHLAATSEVRAGPT